MFKNMKKECVEILQYLESRKGDYVVWGGFAQFAYFGLEASPDIDIYVSTKEVLEMICSDFLRKGWSIKGKLILKNGQIRIFKLEKGGFTFDVIYSRLASELFFNDAVEMEVYGYTNMFVSKEALFLTKLGQLTAINRSENKRKRDLETIIRLREHVDARKVRNLASKLPASYWKTGWV